MKKIMFSMLAAICMLSFTACGSAADSSSAPPETAVQNETQTEHSSEASETEQSDEEKNVPASSDVQPQTADNDKGSGKDTIVVYFSATGTTEGVAERIASVTGGDIFELLPAEPYSSADLDWKDKNSRATIEMNDQKARPAIANDTVDLESYSTVYIGYPIWWGGVPRIMSTFVEAHDFDGKTVIPFCTSGSSPIGRSGKDLASQAGSGNWLEGSRLDAGISENEIQDWISSMN